MNIADSNQRDHNTPCLQTKTLHKHHFQCLLGKLTAEPAFLPRVNVNENFQFLERLFGHKKFLNLMTFVIFAVCPATNFHQKSFFMHSTVVPPSSCQLEFYSPPPRVICFFFPSRRKLKTFSAVYQFFLYAEKMIKDNRQAIRKTSFVTVSLVFILLTQV